MAKAKKTKQEVIDAIKAQIDVDPKGAKKALIGVGKKTYSLEDLLLEIENETAIGKTLMDNWRA